MCYFDEFTGASRETDECGEGNPGITGCRKSHNGTTACSQVWNFASAPDLHPMKVTIHVHQPGTAPGFLFVAPYEYYCTPTIGQTGSLIMDQAGNPVWFRSSDKNTQIRDFKVQSYFGNPVLTWWQGTIAGTLSAHPDLPQGAPLPGAYFQIMNQHYQVIQTVTAKNGYTADNHEFILTNRNTALFLAIKHVAQDLSLYGGPREGYIRNYAIQEIDLNTGRLVFFWDALSHVNPADSYVPASTALEAHSIWDPFHLNSIEEGPDHTLLVSMRDMWTIYNMDKRTGNIMWRLGGKQSDFTMEPNAAFSWQHDARYRSYHMISLFNNACCGESTPPEDASHGLMLKLDYENRTARAIRTYFHDQSLYADHQGNLQQLSNGNAFIGWGVKPFLSEFQYAGNTIENPSSNLLYDMQMPNHTYRAFKHDWVGLPLEPPDIAVEGLCKNRMIVYASWNGSTETAAWQVLAGSTPHTMSQVVPRAPRTGFETAFYIHSNGPCFQVNALDSCGNTIGRSQIVKSKRRGM